MYSALGPRMEEARNVETTPDPDPISRQISTLKREQTLWVTFARYRHRIGPDSATERAVLPNSLQSRITEYPELEGTHEDHPVQPLALHRHPNNPNPRERCPKPLRAVSGRCRDHSLGSLFQCPAASRRRTFSRYPPQSFPTQLQAIPSGRREHISPSAASPDKAAHSAEFSPLQAEGAKGPQPLPARPFPIPAAPLGSPVAVTPALPARLSPAALPGRTQPPAACPRPSPARPAAGRCPRPARTRYRRAPPGPGARTAGWAAPSRPHPGEGAGPGRERGGIPSASLGGCSPGIPAGEGPWDGLGRTWSSLGVSRTGRAAAPAPGFPVGPTGCVSIAKTTTGSQH